jgi:hypothetical protein
MNANASVIYTYTSSTFIHFQDSPVPAGNLVGATNLTLALEFDSAFPSGFSGAVNPLSWSINDGLATLTDSDSYYAEGAFSVPTISGAIPEVYGIMTNGVDELPTQWSFLFSDRAIIVPENNGEFIPGVTTFMATVNTGPNVDISSKVECDLIDPTDPTICLDYDDDFAQASSSLGQWSVTETVVPISAAVWLFGSGLLGLIGVTRRRSNA